MVITLNKNKGIKTLKSLSLYFSVLILLSLIAIIVIDLIVGFDPSIYQGENSTNILYLPTILLVLIIEELSFRLVLSDKKETQVLGLSFFISFVLNLLEIHIFDFGYLLLFFSFIITSVLLNLVLSKLLANKKPIRINTYLLITVSSILFAYSHFVLKDPMILLGPEILFLLPYFLRSIIYSIARVKFGIKYSIALHILFNLFVVILQLSR